MAELLIPQAVVELRPPAPSSQQDPESISPCTELGLKPAICSDKQHAAEVMVSSYRVSASGVLAFWFRLLRTLRRPRSKSAATLLTKCGDSGPWELEGNEERGVHAPAFPAEGPVT